MSYSHLFCVRATNLRNFIDDTDDLKTIRGGSHSLIEMPHELLKAVTKLEAITLGASVGYYGAAVESQSALDIICQEIDEFFSDHPILQYATYALDYVKVEKNSNFLELKEKLATNCHKKKMQNLNFGLGFDGSDTVCKIDAIRPANNVTPKKKLMSENERVPCSNAVAARRSDGHAEKHPNLYERIFEKRGEALSNRKFANDFHDIAYKKNHPLSGKIAVLYCDGTGFGKIIDKIIGQDSDFDTQIEAFTKFDQETTAQREAFLVELVQSFHRDDQPYLQLETLLWGGDEMFFVLPAWRGFEVSALLSRHMENWSYTANHCKHNITYGCGLVFCSAKADIRRIKPLAKDLAEKTKKLLKEENISENLVAYEVMESFDYPAEDFDDFRNKRIPKPFEESDPFILKLEHIKDIYDNMRALHKKIPRGQLHEIVRAIYAHENIEAAFKRLEIVVGKAEYAGIKTGLASLNKAIKTPCEHADILNLHALWDYTKDVAAEDEKDAA